MVITKRQIVKVYNQSGTFLDVWRDAPLLGIDSNTQPPKFAINTVTGQVQVSLPRKFDSFDEGGDSRGRGTIAAGNIVQFWVYDNNSLTSGRMVYQGYIDGYIPQIGTDGSEIVQVLISSFDTALGDVKFVGTQTFGVAGAASTYVDTVQMFDWPFGVLVAAGSVDTIASGTTPTINVTNTNKIYPGMSLYLTWAGGGSPVGPLTVQSVGTGTGSGTITFTSDIASNFNYSAGVPIPFQAIFVSAVGAVVSTTAVTGGVTTTVAAATGAPISVLAPNMVVAIINNNTLSSPGWASETATIQSISGSNITFTAPLQNSYSAGFGILPPTGFNYITNRPYTYPLTLDAGNPALSGYLNQAQLHNQSFVDWFEAVRNLSPLNWFWFTTPQKTVVFKAASTIAQHVFTVGKDVNQPQYQKDFTNLRNDIYVKGTSVTARATGSDIGVYGQRTEVIVEPRIVDANTAQRLANAVLGQLDKVDYRATLTLVDSRGDASGLGFDIETIQVGDSCRVANPGYNIAGTLWDNFLWDVDVWDHATSQLDQVVTISASTYQFDTLALELSSLQPSQDKYLVDLARQYANSQFN